MLSPEGLTMADDKVKCIQDWAEPHKVHDIQSFLGFANFCSNYRIEIGAVGIKNLEDLANRKLLSDCQNTSTLIIPNRKLLYN